jgi:hypothetical protein
MKHLFRGTPSFGKKSTDKKSDLLNNSKEKMKVYVTLIISWSCTPENHHTY